MFTRPGRLKLRSKFPSETSGIFGKSKALGELAQQSKATKPPATAGMQRDVLLLGMMGWDFHRIFCFFFFDVGGKSGDWASPNTTFTPKNS